MARGNLGMTGHRMWMAVLAMCVFLGMEMSSALAQTSTTTRMPRPRALVQQAREAYTRGDYESAAQLYKVVSKQIRQLTPVEVRDLQHQIRLNSHALAMQREGHMQIQQALRALKQGRRNEAAALRKRAEANAYLTAADKQLINQLTARLHKGQSGSTTHEPADKSSVVFSNDYRWLIKEARAALEHGELAKAERFAKQAQKANSSVVPMWLQPWNDSPSKVLRDIQAARAEKQQPNKTAATNNESSGGIAPFKAVRNLFNWRSKSSPRGTAPNKKNASQGNSSSPYNPSQIAPPKTHFANEAEKKNETRRLVYESYKALQNNDLRRARILATRAAALGTTLDANDLAPKQLLPEIARRERANGSARQGSQRVDNAGPSGKKMSAYDLLRRGRELLARGNLEEAAKYCRRAEMAPDAHWGRLLERDNPSRLRAAIQSAKQQRDRQEADKLMARARVLFKQGQLQQAKLLAFEAKKKFGPKTLFDFRERPEQLLARIHAAEIKSRNDLVPPLPADMRKNTPPRRPPVKSASATERLLAKQKAIALLKQARDLQRQNRLIEARALALQAKQAADAALRLGVRFAPDEDNPNWALTQLQGQTLQHIKRLQMEAGKVLAVANDPQRFQKAAGMLQQARQLASAYQFPLALIDQQLTYIQRAGYAAQGVPSNKASGKAGGNVPALAKNQQLGKKLIQDALSNLRQGHVSVAYQIALEAHDPKYNVQREAAQVLNQINTEKFNQKILQCIHAVDLVSDYYQNKQYNKAWNLAGTIDAKLLPPDKRRRFQEIMTTPEMQPDAIARADTSGPGGTGNPPARVSISDGNVGNVNPGIGAGTQDIFDRFRATEQILFMKLRRESLAVQIEARQALARGDGAAALGLLSAFKDQIDQSQLAPERKAMLRSSVDRRLQQFKVTIAQKELAEKRLAALRNKGASHPESKYLARQQKRDREISKAMKEFDELYKKHKYKEALLALQQIRELYPNEPALTAAWTMAKTAARRKIVNRDEDEKAEFFLHATDTPFGPPVDVNNPVAFNKSRLEIARRRKSAAHGIAVHTPTAKELEIEHKLDTPLQINFKDEKLGQVIDDLGYMGGINLVPDRAALKEAGISLDHPMSLKLQNVSLRTALDLLVKQVHLAWVINKEVVEITTEQNSRGNYIQKVYPVADLVIPVVDAPYEKMDSLKDVLNNFNANQRVFSSPRVITPPYMLPGGAPVGSFNGGSPGHASSFASSGSYGAGAGANGLTPHRGAYPKKTIEDQLINLIKATIAPDTWSEVGGKGTIQYFPLGHGLVVNQTQDIQEQVFDLLDALRRLQALEVAIEIRLISVGEEFFEFMGVDFDFILTTRHNAKYQPQLITGTFAPGAQVNRFLPDGFLAGLTPAGTYTPDLNIPLNPTSFNYSLPQIGGFPGALGADGGLSLGLAFLSDIQVFMFMEAAQGNRRVNAMQAPRVTVFNGQLAVMSVFDEIPFLFQITPSFAGNQLYFVPVQSALPVGTQIFVQPVVSADRRFVRLSITQSMQNLVSANVPLMPISVPVVPNLLQDNIALPQPKVFQIFLQQPAFSTITVVTTVTVPDGGTVLLGGLKTMTEQRNEYGPPVLSKIPYISRLFKNVGYGREINSLMMMVTPRIIINEEEELIFEGKLAPIPRP